MKMGVAEKIIRSHLVSGRMKPGEEISISVDQTLTQDATGTLAYLEFEALGIDRVRTALSVSYVDHNTLRNDTGYKNAADHIFLETFAARHGIYFSPIGNGICHQVHLERFGRPGGVLLGSDSHTPTAGGLGMLGIGVGGMDIAAALAGEPYRLLMPEIFRISLEGELPSWISAKDLALLILKKMTVKGGVGKILEYTGLGVLSLSVTQRATVANMGTETGATSSVFPSDRRTVDFLRAQKREGDFREITADLDAVYSDELSVDLSSLEPLVACPHSPDNVRKIGDLAGKKINQVCIGSCTNSSLRDLMIAAAILRGKKVHPEVELIISPGSRQVFNMISGNGSLTDIISAGAIVLENACGPCIGITGAPPPGGVSLRTYNRNFQGRSGTWDAEVFLVSPAVAAASALSGSITDPRSLGRFPRISIPETYDIDDTLIIKPAVDPEEISVIKDASISSIQPGETLPDALRASVWISLGDNITTDAIIPAGPEVLPLRSNIGRLSQHIFRDLDKDFVKRARRERKASRWGIITAGENYGQGSSREHAALAPRFVGVRAVIARSFARIHKANLINFGILPIVYESPGENSVFGIGDEIAFPRLRKEVRAGDKIIARNISRGNNEVPLRLSVTARERKILIAGGLLNVLKEC